MGLLLIAALIWIGVHIGIAGTALRGTIAQHVGERGFRGLFTLISIAAIIFLIVAFRAAPLVPLWYAPPWLRVLLVLAMLPAFILFVGAVARPNPTSVGGDRALEAGARGMQRITRHPMLWSFAIWAAVHIIGNGETAAVLFFGAFLVTALVGMPSIDAKMARRRPEQWPRFAATTSILPFGAIAAGRNRLMANEIGWRVPAIGAIVWLIVLGLHPYVIGVNPLPF